jgi:hypothetical protein
MERSLHLKELYKLETEQDGLRLHGATAMMHQMDLDELFNELKSPVAKRKMGRAVVMKTSARYIAVGTSKVIIYSILFNIISGIGNLVRP